MCDLTPADLFWTAQSAGVDVGCFSILYFSIMKVETQRAMEANNTDLIRILRKRDQTTSVYAFSLSNLHISNALHKHVYWVVLPAQCEKVEISGHCWKLSP